MAEAKAAHAVLGVCESRFLDIPAVYVRDQPVPELNGAIMNAVKEVNPAAVLCCYPDRHIDHRVIFDAVMVATRPVGPGAGIKLVAAFETLSETHWNAPHIEPNFTPNWVVDITDTIDSKLEALACYGSQIPPFPAARSVEALRALSVFPRHPGGFRPRRRFSRHPHDRRCGGSNRLTRLTLPSLTRWVPPSPACGRGEDSVDV